MDSEHREFKKLKRDRFGVKMIAGSFLIVGSLLFVTFLMAYLDPEATIKVNDVPTTSPKAKLQGVLFSSVFVLLGVAGLLLPERLLNRMLIARTSLMSTVGENFLQKIYRLLSEYPFRSCAVFAAFTTFAFGRHFYEKLVGTDDKSSVVLEFIFVLGFATTFYYFGSKFVLWFVLKAGGFGLRGNQHDQ
jgi:hypothetical protein